MTHEEFETALHRIEDDATDWMSEHYHPDDPRIGGPHQYATAIRAYVANLEAANAALVEVTR